MPSNERPHVAQVADRDADLADLAAGELVVRVVAGLGRQVEGDRQTGLALAQVAAGRARWTRPPRSARRTSASPTAGPARAGSYSPVTMAEARPGRSGRAAQTARVVVGASRVRTRCSRVTRRMRQDPRGGVAQHDPAAGQLGPPVGPEQDAQTGRVDSSTPARSTTRSPAPASMRLVQAARTSDARSRPAGRTARSRARWRRSTTIRSTPSDRVRRARARAWLPSRSRGS